MHSERKGENLFHLLQNRETFRAAPGIQEHVVRQFYSSIVPSHTVYEVTCPEHIWIRKFSQDGQYLICFSRNGHELIVYRFHWLNYCTPGDSSTHPSDPLPEASRSFESFFSLVYSANLAPANETLCKDFFLCTESSSHGIFATSSPLETNPRPREGALPDVPAMDRITLLLVRLSDGFVCDRRVFQEDLIQLAHHGGAFLYRDMLCVLSTRFQRIHLIQVRESPGSFLDAREIGKYCNEDDELVLSSHCQLEAVFRQRTRVQGQYRPPRWPSQQAPLLPLNPAHNPPLGPEPWLGFSTYEPFYNFYSGQGRQVPGLQMGFSEGSGTRSTTSGTFGAGERQRRRDRSASAGGGRTAPSIARTVQYITSSRDDQEDITRRQLGLNPEPSVNPRGFPPEQPLEGGEQDANEGDSRGHLQVSLGGHLGALQAGNVGGMDPPPEGEERAGGGASSAPGVGFESGLTIRGMKQRLLGFIFRLAMAEGSGPGGGQLKRYFYHFRHYLDLVMWKAQLLDSSHLLIKFGSAEGLAAQRGAEGFPPLQTAFFALYHIHSTQLIAFFQNSSEKLAAMLEQHYDQFRACPCGPRTPLPSSPSNCLHAREALRRQKAACASAKGGSAAQAIKRTLSVLPFNCQSQSLSPYFDQNLFHFDEKLISAVDRHKPCVDHPIKFISRRRPNALKFKIDPGPESGSVDGRLKRVASYVFHPTFPFAISIQQSYLQAPVVNFHFRR